MIDLGTLGGSSSWAGAVNASGQVVGVSTTAGDDATYHAFVWTREGGMIDLGTLSGGYSWASAMNDRGQVVGGSYPVSQPGHAFSWTHEGGMIDLGTLGGSYSWAEAVNGSGVVVGSSTTAGDEQEHATVWRTAIFTTSGFHEPVDMGGVWNTVKAGATVPLKFEVFVGSTELTDVSVVKQPLTAVEAACDGSPSDDLALAATGATTLRYDAAGQFIYNWQTPRKPGTCYLVTVVLTDDTSITAKFKLR